MNSRGIGDGLAVSFAAPVVVFFCFDARLYQGCRELLKVLQKNSRQLVLVLLRNPYDQAFAGPKTTVVTAYGSRLCQIRACVEKVFGL